MKHRLSLFILFTLILIISSVPTLAVGDFITKDNASGLALFETYPAPQAVYSVVWRPDSTGVVFGLSDGTVLQESIMPDDFPPPAMIGGHTDAVTSVDVSSDNQWIFSGSMDGTVHVWQASTGVMQPASGLSTAVGDPFILTVNARSGSSNEIAYAGEDSIVYQRVWNAPVRPGPPALSGHSNFVFDVEYSHDGNLVATGGADASVRVWSYLSGTQQSIDNTSHTERVYDVAFSHGDAWLVSTGQDRTIWMRPVLSPGEPFRIAEIPDLGSDTVANAVAVGLNNDIVAVGDSNGILRVYSIPSADDIVSHLLFEVDGHTDQIRDLAISPDGTMIATAGFDRTLKIWNIPVLGAPPLPSAVPTLPPPPAPITGDFCPGTPSSHLAIGMRARVTFTDGTSLNLRDAPGGALVMEMAEGTPFNIIGGPICAVGFTWWNITLDSGISGWSAEGDFENYFIEPLATDAIPSGGGSISGVVWHDICNNGGPGIPEFCVAGSGGVPVADGVRSSIEPVIGAVTVQLHEGACPSSTPIAEWETGFDGVYQFTHLDADTYCVSVNPTYAANSSALIPGGWTFPLFFDPTSGIAYHTITLVEGAAHTMVDFGWDFQFAP